MARSDYLASRQIESGGYSFAAILMAAMRRAGGSNLDMLRAGWPSLWDELVARYNAPGGWLPGETPDQEDAASSEHDVDDIIR